MPDQSTQAPESHLDDRLWPIVDAWLAQQPSAPLDPVLHGLAGALYVCIGNAGIALAVRFGDEPERAIPLSQEIAKRIAACLDFVAVETKEGGNG